MKYIDNENQNTYNSDFRRNLDQSDVNSTLRKGSWDVNNVQTSGVGSGPNNGFKLPRSPPPGHNCPKFQYKYMGNEKMVRESLDKSREKYFEREYRQNKNTLKLKNGIEKSKEISTNIVCSKLDRIKKFLFELLDADSDGLISADRVNIEEIPTNLLKIISPILFEMEDKSQVLNRNEFNYSLDRLYKRLTPNEKRYLLNKNQKVHSDECQKYFDPEKKFTFTVSFLYKI